MSERASDSGTVWDAPNQQVVREDGSPPWEEGTGGTPGAADAAASSGPSGDAAADLDAMTKDDLLAYAQELGVVPANASMTKDEIRAGIDAKLAGG